MFWWLAQNTLLAGLLALAAALACRFGRLSPAVRHALWLVVLVKLITPPIALYTLPAGDAWTEWLLPPTAAESRPSATSPAAEPSPAETFVAAAGTIEIWADGPAANDAAAETVAAPIEEPWGAFSNGAEELLFSAPPLFAEEAGSGAVALDEAAVSIDSNESRLAAICSWLAGVWAIGAALMAVLQGARLIGLARLLRRTEAAPRRLTELVQEIAARLQVSAPRVVLTPAACSPMVCALGRPRLVWPKSLAEPLTGDARRAVIAHEFAHLRRCDHWIGWLELAASCGWWWNPLFWYVRRQLRENAELACDAWVVSLLPGGRRAYAQALVEVSELLSWTAAPAPAVGMGASARHLFERRLTMILRERVPCRAPLAGLALIGLLGIAVLPGWTRGQAPVSDDVAPQAEAAAEIAAPKTPGPADAAPVDETRAEPAAAPAESSPDAFPPTRGKENGRPRRDPDPRPTVNGYDRQNGSRRERADEPRTPGAEAEDAAPQDFAFPVKHRLPQGLLLQQADRHAAQIQQLERQLAELTAAVQALRNDGRLPNDAPRDPNRRGGVDFTAARARELAETAGRNPSVYVMDLKQPETEHHIRFHAPAQFRLRLRDDVKLARVDIDKPEVIKLAEQSPHEVVLVAVHPGRATVKLWDDQERAYTLHADVAGGRTDGALRTGETLDLARLRDREAAVRQLENAPGRGEFVETLTRVKYKLPQAKAEALAAFLKSNAGGDVETKVDGETLTVTASPDHQARIGQFIQLLEPAPQRQPQPGERQRSSSNHDPFSTPPVAPATPATTPGVGVLPPPSPAPGTARP